MRSAFLTLSSVSKHNKNPAGGRASAHGLAKASAQDQGVLFQQAAAAYGRQDWRLAEKLCRQLLQMAHDHFDALHLLGSMLLQSQRLADAKDVLGRALSVQPNSAAILTKLGIVCTHLKLASEARDHLDAALHVDPQQIEAYVGRGALHESLGDPAAAAIDFQRAVELRPDFVLAHFLLGNSLALCHRLEDAVASYGRALALAPGFTDALHARGNALRDLGRLEDAAHSYGAAVQLDPNHYASLSSLADLQVDLGQVSAALANLDKVIALKPDNENALLLRARLRYERSELELSYADFARLVKLNPAHAKAYEGIGNIHHRLNRLGMALANYEQSLALDATRGSAHLGRSAALRAMAQLEAALEAAHKAMELNPAQAEVYTNLANIRIDMRQLGPATEHFRRACELNPDFANARSSLLFTLNFQSTVSPQEVLVESRIWEDHHARPVYGEQYQHIRREIAGRRLRIGYVSADIRQHAVAAFMAPIIEHHDRSTVELFCYYCHPGRDETTDLLAPRFEHWVESAALSDAELAQRIHADGIDVLVDLAGHTAGNRLLTFARRPAPVQITYLGYPGTTGLSAMDYRITDAQADPPSADAHYAETLLRLPHSLWCYQASAAMPEVGELPALANGHLTLGSFNNFNKLDARSIELWARLLREVPGTRLVVATVPEGPARLALLESFEALGVQASRIDVLPWLDKQAFWKALERVDVSLDPVTVNGATTTCESLWMGAPVLTRVGARFLERAGLSILTSAGLSEFACESDDACVQRVRDLSVDLPKLAALRAGLRQQLSRTSVFDGATFTRSLEALFCEAWRRRTEETGASAGTVADGAVGA